MELFKTLSRAWKVKEIRSQMIFTFLMLAVFRIGSNIPVPNINRDYLAQMFSSSAGLLDLFDLFSGGALSNFTIFALSITPYVTASIIMQLLTIAIPALERMSMEGNEGRKKMASITRYVTVALSLVQACGMTFGFFRQAVIDDSILSLAVVIMVLTAGSVLLMWMGEKINEHGIGNGISLIIFAGIVSRIPSGIRGIFTQYKEGTISAVAIITLVVVAVLLAMFIITMQQGMRKIPVQYAKRVVGRKMYGGQSSFIPMKVTQAGVIPIIFSLTLLQFPLTVALFIPDSAFAQWANKYLSMYGDPGVWIYSALNIVLTLFFTFFYTAIIFNPVKAADDLRQSGAFIPGIRPGKATEGYLTGVMHRLCFVGGLFLALVASIPVMISVFTPFDFSFGGTSLLIAIGVALDSVQRLENQLLSRNYEGFLK